MEFVPHSNPVASSACFVGSDHERHYDELDMRNCRTVRPLQPPAQVVPLHRQLATIQNADQARLIRTLNLCRETDRYQTFNSDWPLDSAPSGREMAASGWFYLGNLDRTQCFSCGGVLRNWRRLDNPNTEHISHFPHCSMAQGCESRNILAGDIQAQQHLLSRTEWTHEAAAQQKYDLRIMFPCDFPVTPSMRLIGDRVNSFNNWRFTRATPQMIAEAGFYALGVKDRVKCFYCNGGLQNWRQDDNPWEEHAKWYPTCEFLLQQRGPEYIHTIVARFPNINRPIDLNSGKNVSNFQMNKSSSTTEIRQGLPANKCPVSKTVTTPLAYDVPLHRQLANIQNADQARLIRSLNLCRETHRYQTFNSDWPLDSAPSGREMAASGWFYLGNLDRTQCFSCGGVLRNWRRLDNPTTEHISHFPHCAMAQGREDRNIPDSARHGRLPASSRPKRLAEQQRSDLQNTFPCEFSVTPSMRSMQDRVNSFNNWYFTRASPQMIAEAGFFSLGVRDRVKCFYCNGGLQNWRQDDDPWEEHAKWYPTCEFLLQQRGPEFIHTIVARFPNISRPNLRGPGQDVASAQQSQRRQKKVEPRHYRKRKYTEANQSQSPSSTAMRLKKTAFGTELATSLESPTGSEKGWRHPATDEDMSWSNRVIETGESIKNAAEPLRNDQYGVEENTNQDEQENLSPHQPHLTNGATAEAHHSRTRCSRHSDVDNRTARRSPSPQDTQRSRVRLAEHTSPQTPPRDRCSACNNPLGGTDATEVCNNCSGRLCPHHARQHACCIFCLICRRRLPNETFNQISEICHRCEGWICGDCSHQTHVCHVEYCNATRLRHPLRNSNRDYRRCAACLYRLCVLCRCCHNCGENPRSFYPPS